MESKTEIGRRVQRYWYEDGIAEIGFGALLGAVGLLFAIEAIAPKGSLPPSFSALALPVVVILGMIALRLGVRAAKESLTYPRTGYVEYKRRSPARGRAAVAAAMSVSVFAVITLSAWSWTNAVAALQAFVLALVLIAFGSRLGIGRYYVLAIPTLLAGAAAQVLALGESGGTAVVYAVCGAALVVGGGWTLRSYLGRTSIQPDI
jgi:hypothetical protein